MNIFTLLLLIGTIVFCTLYVQNKNQKRLLQDELNRLKEEVNQLKNNSDKKEIDNNKHFCGNCGYDYSNRVGAKFCPQCGKSLEGKNIMPGVTEIKHEDQVEKGSIETIAPIEIKSEKVIKPKMNDTDLKNLSILITGSVLIILSAVVFLTSTWGFTHSIIKSVIIFLLLGLFFGASHIADKKYGLKQAAKAFFYLGNAYLPFALCSLSIFGLLGDAFTSGPLYYTYYAISFVICSGVYIILSKKNKDIYLAVASIIFQCFTVISFINIFTHELEIIFFGLFLYSVFLSLLYEFKYYFYDNKTSKYSIMVISLISVISIIGCYIPGITYLIELLLVLLLGSIIIKRIIKIDYIFKIFYGLLLLAICFSISDTFQVLDIYKGLIFSGGFLLVLVLNYIFTKTKYNKNESTILVISESIFGLLFSCFGFNNYIAIGMFILFLYLAYLSLLYYYQDGKYNMYDNEVTKLVIIAMSCLSLMVFISGYVKEIYYVVLSGIIYLIGLFITKKVIKEEYIFKSYYPLGLMAVCGLTCNVFEFNYLMLQIIFIIGSLIALVIDYIDCKTEINIINYVISLLVFGYLYYLSYMNPSITLHSYLIPFIFTLFSFLDYSFSKDKVFLGISLVSLEVGLLDLSHVLINDYSIGLIVAFGIFALSFISFLDRYKKVLNGVGLYSSLVIGMMMCILNEFTLLVFVVLGLISIILYIRHRYGDNINKISLFLSTNLTFIALASVLVHDNIRLFTNIASIGVWVVILMNIMSKKLRDDSSFGYIMLTYAISVLPVLITQGEYNWLYQIVPILNSLMLICYFIKDKKDKLYYYIPGIVSLISLMIINKDTLYGVALVIIGIICILLLTKNNKNNDLRVLPYLYAGSLLLIDLTIYFPLSLGVLISLYYVLIDKERIVYKIALEACILLTYQQILYDVKITYAVLVYGAYLIATMVLTRYILKDSKDKDAVEYIFLGLTCLGAFYNYSSTFEGLIFVGLLVILMIIAYTKKYEPAFRVSLISIIANVLLLIAKYLLNLPAWLYLLVLGLVIVMFAVYNESKNKKDKENKEKIDN